MVGQIPVRPDGPRLGPYGIVECALPQVRDGTMVNTPIGAIRGTDHVRLGKGDAKIKCGLCRGPVNVETALRDYRTDPALPLPEIRCPHCGGIIQIEGIDVL